jgi:serine/threonine protein kinase
LLDHFEVAWQGQTPPAIEEFLPPGLAGGQPVYDPDVRELLQELIKIDLEYRWRRPVEAVRGPDGNGALPARPRLEDYVQRLPELGPLPRLPLDLVGEEYRVRQRWGDRPGPAEYAGRFPRHGAALREALARIDAELAAEPARPRPAVARPPSPSAPVQLHCPHCHQAIEVAADLLAQDLACPACGGTFSVEALSTAPGREVPPPSQRLGRYELGELLGTGAFGSVWRARDTELAREVAVKLPRRGQLSSPAEEERFLREARSAAQLHHPGIVAVHDVGRDQQTLYIVSELVLGVSLAEWLKHGWMTFLEAAELVAQVADALDYAHRQGVVHRDVKPSNILLELEAAPQEAGPAGNGAPPGEPPPTLVVGAEEAKAGMLPSPAHWRVAGGEGAPLAEASPPRRSRGWGGRLPVGRPRVMDFGLALRDVNEVTMTLDGQLLGTPAYMSPEQVRNPHAVDGRSDVYSLGVILYELLTGELPFRGVTRMLLHQVVSDEPRPPRRLNDKIPRALETICLKCLAKEPGRRYRSAAALAADLRHWRAGEPIRARPAGRAERLWRWARRNPALAAALALMAVALVAVTGAPAAAALVAVTVGALFLALVKTKAAAELAQTVEQFGRNQQKTAATLQFAVKQCARDREERDRAVAAEAQASRRFRQVRELARAVIFDFPDQLGGPPGDAPARAFLVQTALTYLDGLAKEAGEDPILLRELALAYVQVGDVQADPSQPNPADAAAALTSYRKGLEVLTALARAHPDNTQLQRDLAVGHGKVTDLQRALRAARPTPATPPEPQGVRPTR